MAITNFKQSCSVSEPITDAHPSRLCTSNHRRPRKGLQATWMMYHCIYLRHHARLQSRAHQVLKEAPESAELVMSGLQTHLDYFESEWEVTIRNHKDTDIHVAVVEPVSLGLSNFDVLSSNFPYLKLNTTTVRFDVPVAKNQEKVLTYRIRVKRG